MLLRAGIIFVFLVSAHAQPPRSPVFAAITPSQEASAHPLAELIKALDAPGRTRAVDSLDALNRDTLQPPTLIELGEAYRLLGRPEKALEVARVLSARDARSPAGDALSIQALAQAGNYAAAQSAAENALKRFPGDKDLLALYYQVKDRGAAVTSNVGLSVESVRHSPVPVTAEIPDRRPARLVTKELKASMQVPAPAHDVLALEYVPAGAHKRTLLERLWANAHVFYAIAFPRQDAKDVADMARIRAAMDRSETGRAVVAELGGWVEIGEKVDVRMATLPSGVGGLAIPLNGYRDKLFIARVISDQPDAVAAAVLAHELSHIADFRRGESDGGLAIPSELSAHRVQVRTFLEIKRGMSEEERRKAAGGYAWEYSNFIAALWEQ